MVKGYPSRIPAIPWRIPAIPWRIPASGCGWPLFRKTLAGIRVSQRIPKARRVDGRLEGFPSSRQGTCSTAGRISFQPLSMYLDGWKEILPAVKHVPRRLEGNPSSRSLAGPLKGGYLRIPARIPAKAGGYPLADADAGFPRKSSPISATARISGCKAAISTSLLGQSLSPMTSTLPIIEQFCLYIPSVETGISRPW
ncbi:hypothetical protein PGTUg99_029866 [Puccinia graminis f. sp. tritici]|uniref:Uncharacterized protein n=1 Tax=Puccinia graminis f. sp. tritici TaxID=56615 RepID=A0A5B0PQ48_PUCGR|nr:hypothetical protein PGTUg99_029866 [Puccinia graminis f. sp. tritici]